MLDEHWLLNGSYVQHLLVSVVTHVDLLWHFCSAGKNTTDIYSCDADKESKLFFHQPQMADKLRTTPAVTEFHQKSESKSSDIPMNIFLVTLTGNIIRINQLLVEHGPTN